MWDRVQDVEPKHDQSYLVHCLFRGVLVATWNKFDSTWLGCNGEWIYPDYVLRNP